MKKTFIILLLFILIPCLNNFSYARQMPKVKPEVLRSMQSHSFENVNYDSLWSALIQTLYDSDFVIYDIDKDLGHIRALKTFKSAHTNKKRVAGWSAVLVAASAYTVFSYGATAYTMYSPTRRIANEMRDKTVMLDVNVNVRKLNEHDYDVKFYPVEKVLQNADGFSFNSMAPVQIIRIYKPEAYNEFFKQVENNIHI